jgi:hypothetical protein
MNCTTADGIPCATQRRIIPNPLEDFPFPAPVWTMISPFSPSFPAMILSRAAFFFAIFWACRASSSTAGVVSGSVMVGPILDKGGVLASGGLALVPVYDRRRGNATGRKRP